MGRNGTTGGQMGVGRMIAAEVDSHKALTGMAFLAYMDRTLVPGILLWQVDDFEFTAEAEPLASSVATLTLYQLLLGRDPENSHVIEETKTQRIGAIFLSFIRSAEFSEFVLAPLRHNARLRHELMSPGPRNLYEPRWQSRFHCS